MPKSSIEMRTPSLRSWCSTLMVTSPSDRSSDSVTSISSRLGAMPASVMALVT
ncbi:hypothetical protein D3C83_272650 [compost metagenome]